MKHACLVCSPAWSSVFSIATTIARAAPAEPEEAHQTEEAPDGAADKGDDQGDATEEGLGEVEDYKNGFIFGLSHQFHLLRDRGDPIGAALGHTENLLGFMLAYARILHPYVSLTFVKAFYFNQERLDSPFEILVNGLYRKNKWEPFVAAGVLTSIRVFYNVRDENGVAEKEFSFGLRFVVGVKYFVTEHWAVSFEFGYSFVPGSDIVEHEISDCGGECFASSPADCERGVAAADRLEALGASVWRHASHSLRTKDTPAVYRRGSPTMRG